MSRQAASHSTASMNVVTGVLEEHGLFFDVLKRCSVSRKQLLQAASKTLIAFLPAGKRRPCYLRYSHYI